MAITDPRSDKVVEQGFMPMKATLARACKCGDVLGVAEDNFDDFGPENAGVNGHDTGVTYVPRAVAGQDGEAGDEITVYPMAVVSGYTGGAGLGTKVYPDEADGKISESAAGDTGDCGSLVGFELSATTVFLHPGMTGPPDTIA